MTNIKTNTKSPASKLLSNMSSSEGITPVDQTAIVLAAFGYVPDDLYGKSPVKKMSFKLTKMATPMEFAFMVTLLRMAECSERDILDPALLNSNTGADVVSQFTVADLTNRINTLLNAAADDTLAIDQFREAYIIATALRAKRVRVITIATASIVIALVVAAGVMWFRDKKNSELQEPMIVVEEDIDDDDVTEDPIIVVSDDDTIDFGDGSTNVDSIKTIEF